METLIHGYFGTWMLGDMDNWRPVYLETQIFCEKDIWIVLGKPVGWDPPHSG